MSGERKNFHFLMHMLKFWCELGAAGGGGGGDSLGNS